MFLFGQKVHPFPLHLPCCIFFCCCCFCFERVSSCVKSSQCQYSRSNGDDDFCRDQAALIVHLPIHHLRHLILLTALKAHTAPFRLLHSEFKWFSLLRKKALVMCRFNHINPLFCVYFRAALQPRAVCLPQWEDAVYPDVLAVWRLDSVWGQEWRDGLSPWVQLT